MKPKSVTARRKAFAAHYIASRDPVSAAVAAGYSDNAAASQGARPLEDVDVRALIAEAKRRENDGNDVTRMLHAMLRLDLTRGGRTALSMYDLNSEYRIYLYERQPPHVTPPRRFAVRVPCFI